MATLYFRDAFVFDENCEHLATSVPKPFTPLPLTRIGITRGRGTPDDRIVEHAREAGCIIVTADRQDFKREMKLAASRCTAARCYEGGGMITVPGGSLGIPFGKISKAMAVNGSPVNWHDVYTCNLHVALYRDGKFAVKPLPVCEFFRKDHADCERCKKLGLVA